MNERDIARLPQAIISAAELAHELQSPDNVDTFDDYRNQRIEKGLNVRILADCVAWANNALEGKYGRLSQHQNASMKLLVAVGSATLELIGSVLA